MNRHLMFALAHVAGDGDIGVQERGEGMARVKEYGTPFVRSPIPQGAASVLICGGCGGEVDDLTSYGSKWLCDPCYDKKFAVKEPQHA